MKNRHITVGSFSYRIKLYHLMKKSRFEKIREKNMSKWVKQAIFYVSKSKITENKIILTGVVQFILRE